MTKRIRAIALGVFVRNGRILAIRYQNNDTGNVVYRPPGGSIEFGERSRDAIRREIREELHSEINDLRYLGAVENIFGADDVLLGHEIVQLFSGELARSDLYAQETVPIIEANGLPFTAYWVNIAACRRPDGPMLVPRALLDHLPQT